MQPRGGGGSGGGERMAVRKGPWTAEEDEVLQRHVREHGPSEWSSIRSKGLLPRTGKSCRLRWVNKLRPNLKTGCKFSAEEERVVIDLQAQFGNKWARIATYLPGRTDNDVKNFWSTRQKRLARMLRAPLPRRRSGIGRQSGGAGGAGASSSPAASRGLLHASSELLCQDQDPCFDMIPFQGTTMQHHIGQSSQEPPLTADHCTGAPFPGFLAPESVLPSPIGFAAAAGCSSSYSAPAPAAHHPLSFLCAGDPAPMAGHAAGLVVDAASIDDDGGVAYMGPKPERLQQQPAGFFGLEEGDDEYGHIAPARRDTPDVLFDDLPPEMFDFFELLPSPSPPPLHPPPPPPSTQL